MIYALMDSAKEYLYGIRHLFRMLFCKDYIAKPFGYTKCKKQEHYCALEYCPKRKKGDDTK